DIMASRVDYFKHAGQLLARLRELQPGRAEAAVLQKLSAVEALIALQFYDDAEQALARLETSPTAAVENTFGLVYQGGLDDYRAERAYKRAIELDPHWAAPHYNLALLYNSQKKDGALPELEEAAKLAPSNSAILEMLGDQYFSNSKWAEAEGAYRKAISTGDKSDRLHTKLGHALYSQGLRDQADKEYKIARELAGQK
ncbi:MAG TPA: hypothetical protein VJX67_00905, partial [Blastocatellia bacterium]|nr:hypothetical protein [Blastocatellia bacterium]